MKIVKLCLQVCDYRLYAIRHNETSKGKRVFSCLLARTLLYMFQHESFFYPFFSVFYLFGTGKTAKKANTLLNLLNQDEVFVIFGRHGEKEYFCTRYFIKSHHYLTVLIMILTIINTRMNKHFALFAMKI